MKFILPFTLAFLAVLLAGCGRPKQSQEAAPPSVVVSQPSEEPVADSIELTGTVAPSKTVDLVARVSGYLLSADFKEGAFVDAGQVLFVIEPEPYEQQLLLAQAALLRAQAEYDRQLVLSNENATSAATVERWLSERDQSAAQVQLAKINLGYTRVAAPFTGLIGRRFVDPGNLVGPSGNTKLATLEQMSPIYVYFSLNERDALRIRDSMRQQGIDPRRQAGLMPVFVGLQNQEGFPQEGTLDFMDTALDTSTGTALMRASLKNEDRALAPGLFARVRIPLSRPRPMLVIPNSSIANDQEGDYVLVVDANQVAVRRPIVRGPLVPKGCAIRSGLAPQDRVIVSGQMKARPGSKVTPVNASAGAQALAKPAA